MGLWLICLFFLALQAAPAALAGGAAPSTASGAAQGDRTGKVRVGTFIDAYGLWIDPKQWSRDTEARLDEHQSMIFRHAGGKLRAYLTVASEAVDVASLKAEAFRRARETDPGADIVEEGTVMVGGRPVDFLRIAVKYANEPHFTYRYLFGGEAGSFRLAVTCPREAFEAQKPAIEDFLGGVDIASRQVPTTVSSRKAWHQAKAMVGDGFGRVRINGGRILLLYDLAAWAEQPYASGNPEAQGPNPGGGGQSKSAPPLRVSAGDSADGPRQLGVFNHLDGGATARVVFTAEWVPFKSLLDWSLNLAREEGAGSFEVRLQEKVEIENRSLWLVIYRARLKSKPVVYYGYLYSGPEGTFQALSRGEEGVRDIEEFASSITFP